ncbi:MAG: hypothetical protein V3U16_09440 [Candidatus Neomarinimicrobiota bacterium]
MEWHFAADRGLDLVLSGVEITRLDLQVCSYNAVPFGSDPVTRRATLQVNLASPLQINILGNDEGQHGKKQYKSDKVSHLSTS